MIPQEKPKAVCTCLTEGSFRCKFPHPCNRCHSHHPGVSCYWHAQGKTPADKREGKVWGPNSGGLQMCDECCNGDRCDDSSHFDRENCPFCLGSAYNKTADTHNHSEAPHA